MSESARVFAAEDNISSAPPPAPASGQPASVQIATIAAAMALVLAALGVSYISGDKTLLSTVVSATVAASMILFNFQFGSSKSSQSKDATLAKLAGDSR